MSRIMLFRIGFAAAVLWALFSDVGRPMLGVTLASPWNRVELFAAFFAMMLLAWGAFPRTNPWLLWLGIVIAGLLVEIGKLTPPESPTAAGSNLVAMVLGSLAVFLVGGLVLVGVAQAAMSRSRKTRKAAEPGAAGAAKLGGSN